MDMDMITQKVIGCAIEVHKTLGPGLLESSYENCLAFELTNLGGQINYATTYLVSLIF